MGQHLMSLEVDPPLGVKDAFSRRAGTMRRLLKLGATVSVFAFSSAYFAAQVLSSFLNPSLFVSLMWLFIHLMPSDPLLNTPPQNTRLLFPPPLFGAQFLALPAAAPP